MGTVGLKRYVTAGTSNMVKVLMARFSQRKRHNLDSLRLLAFERYEPRVVMDHAVAATAAWMGGSEAFFNGSTVTIQNGGDVFVVDVGEATPRLLSKTSVKNSPAALTLDGNELTLVVSSQVGLSEILVYDLSDPANPIEKRSQSVEGIVTRAWIANEKIILQTIDPEAIPEIIPQIIIDDSTTMLSNFSDEEGLAEASSIVQSDQEQMWSIGATNIALVKPTWDMPTATLAIYDRAQLTKGPVVQSDQCGLFDEIVMLPDGIVTVASVSQPKDETGVIALADQEQKDEYEPIQWFTSTTLSRWIYDDAGSSLDFKGSYILENGRTSSGIESLTKDSVTSLFLVTVSDTDVWDTRLHRFVLGDEVPFEHSELKLSDALDQSWVMDFKVSGELGVVGTNSKLALIDLTAKAAPVVSASLAFPSTASTWKMLEEGRWLRIYNQYSSESFVDGTSVSLEVIEISGTQIQPTGEKLLIEGDERFWSAYGPSSFTYLRDAGVLVANMQRYRNLGGDAIKDRAANGEVGTSEESSVPNSGLDLGGLITDFSFPQSWYSELHILRMDGEDGIVDLGNVEIDAEVKKIGEHDGRLSLLTDRDVVVIDLKNSDLTRSSLSLVPAICPYDMLGIDPQDFAQMLTSMGLGFVQTMMDSRGNYINLEMDKIVDGGQDELISITIGNECWQFRMSETGESELVSSEMRAYAIASQQPDVNGDGEVNDIDAKMLMERLNQRGFYPEPTVLMGSDKEMLMDINGDGWLSALDPLVVINRINFVGLTVVGLPVDGSEAEGDVIDSAKWLAPIIDTEGTTDSYSYSTTDVRSKFMDLKSVAQIRSVATDQVLCDSLDWQTEQSDDESNLWAQYSKEESGGVKPLRTSDDFEALVDDLASTLLDGIVV